MMSGPFPTLPAPVALPPLPPRYRALIFSLLGPVFAGLLSLSTILEPGRPLGGVGWLTIIGAILTSFAVYWPANPWAKFVSALTGAILSGVLSMAQGGFSLAEIITLVLMLGAALGVGAFPNPQPQHTRDGLEPFPYA